MAVSTCPTCGGPLGAGALAGMCPRCLVAGPETDRATQDAVAVLEPPPPDSPPPGGARTAPLPGSPPTEPGTTAPERDEAGPTIDEPLPPWSDREPSPRIEGYDVLRPLKQGGQGIVHLAVQRSTKRKVAVKLLLDGQFASKSARRRFEREIELAAGLKHPNIIPVFDSGTTADGHAFYVMDYVRGVPVTQHVREHRLGLGQVLSLFAAVCDAVNHAHQRGVIHRDLKPSNILVDVDGHVRVLDFGLAKSVFERAESVVSVTGSVVGTFPYMSPEQTRGNPDEMDTRTDVYALGVILYEALTGKHPYPVDGTVAEVVRHICETPPQAPARAWTAEAGVAAGHRGRCPIDPELTTVLLKALAKERERRYESAGQFARDLGRYLGGEAVVARRPSAAYQLRVFARRHTALVAATLTVAAVLVVSLAVLAWQLRVATRARAQADAARSQADAARAVADAAVESTDEFLSYGGDDAADAGELLRARLLFMNALDQARDHGLSGSSTLAGLLELGGRDGAAVPLLGSYGGAGGPGGFRADAGKPTNVALLRTRRLALTGGDTGELTLWDLDTGRCVSTVKADQGKINYVAVSPNEAWAVSAGANGTVHRWDVTADGLRDTGVIMTFAGKNPGDAEAVWVVAVSGDGSRVLAGGAAGQLAAWDSATRTQRPVGRCPDSCAAAAFLPDDPHFALTGDSTGNIRLWDLDAGRELWQPPLQHYARNVQDKEMQASGRLHVNCLAFSGGPAPAVASVGFDGSMVVWDARGSGPGFTLTRRFEPVKYGSRPWRVAFADDGSTVAMGFEYGVVRLVDAHSGKTTREFRAQEQTVEGVAFLDGRTLVSTGGGQDPGRPANSALMVWDTAAASPQAFGGAVSKLEVDDDGRVRVTTGSGPVERVIGQDGNLHEGWAAEGAAAPPWAPPPPAPGAKRATPPSWGLALRSTSARDPNASPGARPTEAAVLPGGKAWLYTGAKDLQLWGVRKEQPRGGAAAPAGPVPMRVFRGHRGPVTAAACSPNGRYVVSGDATGVVKVWDLLRPLRWRELEQKMASQAESVKNGQVVPDPAALREWYAFRGRPAPAATAPAGQPATAPH